MINTQTVTFTENFFLVTAICQIQTVSMAMFLNYELFIYMPCAEKGMHGRKALGLGVGKCNELS